MIVESRENEAYSVDFMSDNVYHGYRTRVSILAGNRTRESLALYMGQRWGVDQVMVGRSNQQDHR